MQTGRPTKQPPRMLAEAIAGVSTTLRGLLAALESLERLLISATGNNQDLPSSSTYASSFMWNTYLSEINEIMGHDDDDVCQETVTAPADNDEALAIIARYDAIIERLSRGH